MSSRRALRPGGPGRPARLPFRARRRLAAVEAALTPTELVVRWLDGAHAFGSLDGYVRSQLDESPADTPINRLARAAVAGATAASRGRGAEAARAAVRAALAGTVFRFELAMRVVVTSQALLEHEVLIDAALAAHVSMLASLDGAARRRDPAYRERLALCRDTLLSRADGLEAAQRAREAVGARHLAGRPALLPDALAAWEGQVQRSRVLSRKYVQ